MLVLGRKTDQSVMIGDDIIITILGIEGDRVKVGIEAPASIRILRQELYEDIKAENLRAAKLAASSSDKVLPSLQGLFQKPKE